MKEQIQEASDGLALSVDKALYESDAVLKTAHRFSEQCYIRVGERDNQITVCFKPKDQSGTLPGRIVDDFYNELIDEQVRVVVNRECGAIRDQIVKKAFSPIE